jgi:hypothetical protein
MHANQLMTATGKEPWIKISVGSDYRFVFLYSVRAMELGFKLQMPQQNHNSLSETIKNSSKGEGHSTLRWALKIDANQMRAFFSLEETRYPPPTRR